MLPRLRFALAGLLIVGLAATVQAAEKDYGLKKGTPDLKMAGPLGFGPDGILFIGDPQGAAVFAFATGDTKAGATGELKVGKVDEKIAGMLGTTSKDLIVNDLAVNPASGNAYVSVSRGKGPNAVPALLRIDRAGKIEDLQLKDLPFAKAALPNASDRQRTESITQVGFVDGKVVVAGLSNEEFASKLRVIPFPFANVDRGASIEIWHSAHGAIETRSPVRTFTPYTIKGETYLLAAYTCTPLVKIPMSELQPGQKIKGATVAELGNMNKPLDMFVYEKGGKNYILMSNSARGMMKITTENLDGIKPLTEPVRGGGKAGLTYETIESLKKVEQMAKLDKDHALVMLRDTDGALNLITVPLP